MDPLGGSYYVEKLTDDLEREAEGLFAKIEEQGGVVRGLETGWLQKRINESAARQQWEIEQHRRLIVGVNAFQTEEKELTIPLLEMDEEAARAQAAALAKLRTTRDGAKCAADLDALREAARGSKNLVPFILECSRSYCTLYEIRAALEDVFGAYREPVFF
jgi:methylmalonyl-CoA mutase N-terminal domain/subunit